MYVLKPIFIAHRGYAAAYPENTLIALDAAQQAGAKFVEVDIQLSADHVPVLFHDRDLQRLCQQNGAIHDYTFSQLEQFNVTDVENFSNQYTDNKITSLTSFIDYLKKYPDLNAFIELKRSMVDKFGEELVLKILLPLFEGMKKQISIISYDQSILKNIHDNTDYRTGIVVDEWNDYNKNAGWQSEWVFCSVEGLPGDNDELEINSKLAIFEVGDVELAKKLLARGICYLETFRIKEMQEAFFNGDNH
ncbi:MAG: glycerophosphodiester phosphodiesterase family protein [Gammaproteobacteria bacterium]|nr:glycerophosphodiester phosphodiesterase family protein [Gammaproteobacteria bacterium]MDH5660319.1 glycerophosphodiester phosphodiesterase family protein [Gammaproteobacteria bacterium]